MGSRLRPWGCRCALVLLGFAGPALAAPRAAGTAAPVDDASEVEEALLEVETKLAGFEAAVADLARYSEAYAAAPDIRRLAPDREVRLAQIRSKQESLQAARERLHIRLNQAELRQTARFLSGLGSLSKYPAKDRLKAARAEALPYARASESVISRGYDARERQRKADARADAALRSLEEEGKTFLRLAQEQESAERVRWAFIAAAACAAALAAFLLARRHVRGSGTIPP